jgi:hypothetical protein
MAIVANPAIPTNIGMASHFFIFILIFFTVAHSSLNDRRLTVDGNPKTENFRHFDDFINVLELLFYSFVVRCDAVFFWRVMEF